MPLGKTLATLRKSRGMTQGDLGEKLNISAQAISKWENGTSEPDIATLKRIADIYGITVGEIIDPENTRPESKDEPRNDANESEEKENDAFDVSLTAINEERKITAIAYLRNLLGIDLLSAKNAVENLPFIISGGMNAEECEMIREYFESIGATVTASAASGNEERRELNFKKPEQPKNEKKGFLKWLADIPDMVKRFVVATLTALIPAIGWLVIILPGESTIDMKLLASYIGLAIFATVFQLWYPTLVRKLLGWGGDIWASVDGLFSFIGAIILSFIYFAFFIVMVIASPVFLIFSLPVRIKRMIEDDWDDDIFF